MSDKKENLILFLRKIAIGVTVSTLIAGGMLLYKPDAIGEIFIYETIPYYDTGGESRQMFKLVSDSDSQSDEDKSITALSGSNNQENNEYIVYTDGLDFESDTKGIANGQLNEIIKIEDFNSLYSADNIIGTGNVIYQDESHSGDIENHFPSQNITTENLEKMHDIQYLKNNFYTVDKTTGMAESLFNIDKFLSADLTINKSSGPQILIFHTHASESYADSDINNPSDGIVGVGERLAEILKNEYGLNVLHIKDRYDVVDGKTRVLGAYERMEPGIQKIIGSNPSIQLVIDLHRDGLENGTKLVTEIDGKPTAKIMFFNGLSMLKNENGELENIDSLPNPNLESNLALSFNLQLEANRLYPGFARKIYLKGYRFSLHMLPKSMLVEVGANTNTKEEAFNTAKPLADIIANVVLNK